MQKVYIFMSHSILMLSNLHYRVQLNIKYRLDFSNHLTFKVFSYIYMYVCTHLIITIISYFI